MGESSRKVVIVTGGTGGIGTEICRRLERDGYRVVAADISVEPRDGPLEQRSEAVYACHVDIREQASVDRCVELSAGFGPLHGLVNCAGLLRHGRIGEISEEGMATVWDVNVAGAVRMCRAAVPRMRAGGAIVNISSVTASLGRLRGGGIYGASKAALEALTRYLAQELAPAGIRVNALAPGFIEVLPMSRSMRFIASGETDEEAMAYLVPQIGMRRMGAPSEMAGPTAFLLSDDASYVTGQVLHADGGLIGA